jgi:hypothetical protein
MIFLSKEEWKEFWEVARYFVFGILMCGFAVSFIMGAHDGFYQVGCQYNSVASRLNVGYVGACELWKPRFKDKKPCETKTVVSISNKVGLEKLVLFDDGSTAVREVPTDMVGKKLKVCE